ncbi:MAG: rhodanese-like domain-containing protein [Terrimicrobiaceae bacterium]
MTKSLNIFLLIFTCFLSGEAHLRADPENDALANYAATLEQEFPDVPTISTKELAALDPAPLLMDVRAEKEYAVSHLAKAIRAGKDPAEQLIELGISKNSSIVVYCSVGYRSSLLAQKLRESGFLNVRNLEGSIFAWANEGRPLVNANGPTTGVHPFDVTWGRYLLRENWRWKPEQNTGD